MDDHPPTKRELAALRAQLGAKFQGDDWPLLELGTGVDDGGPPGFRLFGYRSSTTSGRRHSTITRESVLTILSSAPLSPLFAVVGARSEQQLCPESPAPVAREAVGGGDG